MIPAKIPAGTTLAQWQTYAIELEAHEAHWKELEPDRMAFDTDVEYESAMRHWTFESMVSAPNQPGYYRANND